MKRAFLFAMLLPCIAAAETPRSPYRITWLFPDNELSAIEVDRGDLSVSRFESDYELVQFLEKRAKQKPSKAQPGAEAVPGRELRIEQLDTSGKVRSTERVTLRLPAWRTALGDRLVERLEDEFDAHLRMLFPRKSQPPTPSTATP